MPTQGNQLQLSFGVNAPESRAIHKDATLPDNSPVGVKLDGYADYANLVYKGTTTGGTQSWALTEGSVTLTDTKGTIYAYWPYSSTTSIDAIDVDMTAADQTDWLYATPVTGIYKNNAEAAVTMNHAAANINITINKGTYLGSGAISNITLQSEGIALGGTFNAAQATPDYTAFEDEGKPLSRDLTITTGAATDIMVVPTGASAAITFTATIDGIQFTVASAAVKLEKGNSYVYTLNLSDISTYMTIGSFGVTPWTTLTGGNLNLKKDESFDLYTAADGVYAVTSIGKGVNIEDADESCIGVALVQGSHKFMIAKNDMTEGSQTWYWTQTYADLGLTNYATINGSNTEGYFVGVAPPQLSTDFTTWTTGAWSDFNGKDNTPVIAASSSNAKDMCKALETFNSKDSKGDWYVPALGQLTLIYLNAEEINEILVKIGGTSLDMSAYYWSSTECDNDYAWFVKFTGTVGKRGKGFSNNLRFVRDIEVKPAVNSADKANGVYVITATGELVDMTTVDPTAIGVALITDRQRIMIAKEEATDGTNIVFQWGKNLYQKEITALANNASSSAARADFSGKSNTAAIIAAYSQHSVEMDAKDMCKVLEAFNAGTNSQSNEGFKDWYIPAAGQLYQIYTNRTDINAALTAISGNAFKLNMCYWSSTEYNDEDGKYVNFQNGYDDGNRKYNGYRVHFVRDIP